MLLHPPFQQGDKVNVVRTFKLAHQPPPPINQSMPLQIFPLHKLPWNANNSLLCIKLDQEGKQELEKAGDGNPPVSFEEYIFFVVCVWLRRCIFDPLQRSGVISEDALPTELMSRGRFLPADPFLMCRNEGHRFSVVRTLLHGALQNDVYCIS